MALNKYGGAIGGGGNWRSWREGGERKARCGWRKRENSVSRKLRRRRKAAAAESGIGGVISQLWRNVENQQHVSSSLAISAGVAEAAVMA